MRKKVDSRISTLIENIISLHQRGFFILVGDRGRDQVVNLHYLLMKHLNKTKPKVLWCYKKELGFSSSHQKRMREIKKQQQKGSYDNEMENPFELFLSSTVIHFNIYIGVLIGNQFYIILIIVIRKSGTVSTKKPKKCSETLSTCLFSKISSPLHPTFSAAQSRQSLEADQS